MPQKRVSSMKDDVETNETTKRFLRKVAQRREEARRKFGHDYRQQKPPLFLLGLAAEHFGRVAEAVVGNASKDVTLNAGLAKERLIELTSVCASLYELIDDCSDLNHLRRALDE